MTLKCIIIDDEPVARKLLEEYIEDVSFLQLVGKAENPVKANALLGSTNPDLMFLDINMPKMTGIQFLRTSSSLPLAILTTAYTEYAVESFEFNVLDYLVKPFSFERFLKSCNKAKEYFEKLQATSQPNDINETSYFFVKCNGRIEKIFYDELVYVEAMLNYVTLHTENKKFIAYLTMKNITEQLPNNIFLKVHKSTIINVNKIISIEGNEIDMGKAKVIVSQNLQEEAMRNILKDRLLKR